MKNKWVLGVLVLVVILGGLFLMGYLETPGDDESDIGVAFFDSEGNQINTLAIMAGGQEVETMRVKVTWTIQATGIKPESFYVDVVVKVDLWDWSLDDYVQLASISDSSTELISEYEYTWTLADLLPMDEVYKTDGWKLRIYATLRGYAEDLSGAPVESGRSTTDSVYAELTWLDTTGTLQIVLYEIKRYIQLP